MITTVLDPALSLAISSAGKAIMMDNQAAAAAIAPALTALAPAHQDLASPYSVANMYKNFVQFNTIFTGVNESTGERLLFKDGYTTGQELGDTIRSVGSFM